MESSNRNQARITAGVALLLCLLVGCYAQQSQVDIPPALPKPSVNLATLKPPIFVTVANDADWHQPVVISEPRIKLDLTVPAPILPLPDMVAELAPPEQIELDAATAPDVVDLSIDAVELQDEIQTAQQNVPPAVVAFRGAKVEPGTLIQTTWTAGEALHGAQIPTPILVARGTVAGPTLCVTAAVHGDELNGIEAVRRLMYNINPKKLTGTIIGVPIVNLQGFQRHSRYLADRRDLNRFFPGNPRGSAASRMAHSFFTEVIERCDGLVDLHTGSFHRTNLPQLRADLQNEEVVALTKGFGATVILHSSGGEGTLRRSAVNAGIPAVTLEAGEPLRLQEDAVEHTVKALFTLLDTLQMYDKRSLWGNPEPTYYSSAWVRADQGGLLLSSVKLGRRVKTGDTLGTVTDPISNEQVNIVAPYTGRVIGMALNQFVMPGFATYHIATEGALDALEADSDDYHGEGIDIAVMESLGAEESE
jgi:uncharacterized protein